MCRPDPRLSVPREDRRKLDTIIELTLDGSATDIRPLGGEKQQEKKENPK